MADTVIGKILRKAAHDPAFRRRALDSFGSALAEEGFILTDAEMTYLREFWESLSGLGERAAYERIMAKVRGFGL